MSLLRLKTPSARFERLGDFVGGEVTEDAREVDQFDFDSNLRLYWSEDGRKVTEKIDPASGNERKPCKQLVVHVQTEMRDSKIPGDDGVRAIFCKSGLLKAVRAEAQRLRISEIKKGMTFVATWVDEEPPPPGRRGKPSKVYEVKISVPPSGLLAEPEPVADDLAERTHEAIARTQRAHASSPVLNRQRTEEPPF
jgi:hypothetical protein